MISNIFLFFLKWFPLLSIHRKLFQSNIIDSKNIIQCIDRWQDDNCLERQMVVSCTQFLVSVFLKLSSCIVQHLWCHKIPATLNNSEPGFRVICLKGASPI